MPYTIHEFSTGLTIETTPGGGWKSKGDTGTWMNSTVEIEKIPKEITNAIRDSKFDARSISASQPAIIGRVIKGNDGKYWSVVAVITPGQDESRTLEAYRYFWCEGEDDFLWVIVGWLSEQNNTPIFNPFEKPSLVTIDDETARKYMEQVQQKTININNDIQLKEWLQQSFPPPIICSPNFLEKERMPLLTMDEIAVVISGKKHLISWAYNVASLEKQEQFLLILAASKKAYDTFYSLKPAKPYSVVAAEIASESDLNSAIQGLMSVTNIPKNLATINEVIEKLKGQDIPQIEEYFTKVFDKLGATDALKNNIQNVGMLELLTLRAILLPKTLPEYLSYAHLEQKSKMLSFANANNSIKQQSLSFQSSLRQVIKSASDSLPNLKAKLRDGLITTIEKLLYKKISIETAFWLINDEQSLWSLSSENLIQNVKSDLHNIQEKLGEIRGYNDKEMITKKVEDLNLKIWFDLVRYYWIPTINKRNLPIYEPLSKVFSKSTMLVFYFSKISGIKVHEEIIKHLKSQKINQVFGIQIEVPYQYQSNPQQQGNGSSSKWVEYVNIAVCIVAIFWGSLVIVNDWWVKIIFAFVALLWTVLFFEFEPIRTIIKNFSLPLIIIAFIFGNSSSTYFLPASDKTTSPPSPTPSSSSSSQGTANLIPEQQRQEILDKAVLSFIKKGKTHDAIEQIKTNLRSDNNLITNSSLNFSQDQDKDTKIISALNYVLFSPGSYDNYKSIDAYVQNNPDDKDGIKQQLNPLVKAIYEYQNKNKDKIYTSQNGKKTYVKPDGIINLADLQKVPNSTMAVLQRDIRERIIKDNKY
ncbi:hypothetical protein [Nostoc sp. ATCC 53789]|nr:hypothetical protein [Nostoc sp. ATCC 53789]QHG21168.1 hypothetical protein GJB62_35570 [Nostoc sp. ATCC 53789]RCJ19456.1 hypothetical protein A6V25_26795 [Nostoc sp. ATCC 53789]